MPELLSLGRFAKLCHTTTDTLIHYDNIGLFPPAHQTSRHRRYYHISQCYTFRTIQFLAELNLSLSEIRTLLSTNSLPLLTDNLNRQLKALEMKTQFLKDALRHTEKMQLLQNLYAQNSDDEPFLISHRQACNMFATLSQSYSFSPESLFPSLEHHMDICSTNHIYPFPFGFFIKKESLHVQNSQPILIYSAFPCGIENNRTLVRPAGEFAALIHKDSLKSINHSLQKLKEYISKYPTYFPGDTFITCYDNCTLTYQDSCYLVEMHMIPLTQTSWQ